MRLTIAGATVACLAVSVSAYATPIGFSEAVSGDLPDSGPLTAVGTVDAGTNTVSGSMSFISTAAGSTVDFDSFAFDVAAGVAVTGISFTWALTPQTGPIGQLFSADIDYELEPFGASTSQTVAVFDSGTSSGTVPFFAGVTPVGEGTYEVTHTGDGLSGLGAPGESLGWTLDYTWTLTAAATTPPGSSPTNPVLPTSTSGSTYVFQDVGSGLWFDPPLVTSYLYEALGGTLFTGVQFPSGFGDNFTLFGPGCTFGPPFAAMTLIDLTAYCGSGISQFTVSGLSPAADAGDPEGFPTYLTFNGSLNSFQMTGVESVSAVPEPSALILLTTGLAGLAVRRRRTRRS